MDLRDMQHIWCGFSGFRDRSLTANAFVWLVSCGLLCVPLGYRSDGNVFRDVLKFTAWIHQSRKVCHVYICGIDLQHFANASHWIGVNALEFIIATLFTRPFQCQKCWSHIILWFPWPPSKLRWKTSPWDNFPNIKHKHTKARAVDELFILIFAIGIESTELYLLFVYVESVCMSISSDPTESNENSELWHSHIKRAEKRERERRARAMRCLHFGIVYHKTGIPLMWDEMRLIRSYKWNMWIWHVWRVCTLVHIRQIEMIRMSVVETNR